LRLAVHDYAGHPLAAQLSRALARRGHRCHHLYCAGLVSPRGPLSRRADDPPTLGFVPVEPPFGIDKGRLVRRAVQETAYGRALARALAEVGPDVVVSANCPLDAQTAALAFCRRTGARFVFWAQDLLGVGSDRVLRRRLGPLGAAVGGRYRRLERRLLRASDAVVLISEDFRPFAEEAGCRASALHVIENWGPLEELPPLERDNAWAREHGLVDRRVLLYSGTLGMKHDPALLLGLATRLERRRDVRVVVVSEGTGADWLRARVGRSLLHLGFQPFERLPEVLASADVLLALLEPDAGVFSVPSKVLTGLCAGRPLLLAVPPQNLAARIVREAHAGLVVTPGSVEDLAAAAERLLDDAALRAELGANARAYAERVFDIERIANRFERVLAAD